MVTSDEIDHTSFESFVRTWVRKLENATALHSIRELYCGRGFSEYLAALERLDPAESYIISAGLGLVHFFDKAPNYDFTASPNSAQSPLRMLKVTAGGWWEKINTARSGNPAPLSALLSSGSFDLALICISKSYLPLILSDFEEISPTKLEKIRVIGPIGTGGLSEKMAQVLMPYTHNLDGPDSPNPGTKSDYCQRAFRHFVEQILAQHPNATVSEHARQVELSMSLLRQPTLQHNRIRLSDIEVTALIERHWEVCHGKSGQTLRHLRDQGFACEQARFAKIFRNYKRKRLNDHV